jgi:hypothetical protein
MSPCFWPSKNGPDRISALRIAKRAGMNKIKVALARKLARQCKNAISTAIGSPV